jgi:hypothetical protein
MKRQYVFVTVLLVSLTIAFGAKSGAPQADDASKIVAMENLWNQMQMNHDAAAMEQMLNEDFVLTDYDGTLSNKSQFLDSIKDMSIKLTQAIYLIFGLIGDLLPIRSVPKALAADAQVGSRGSSTASLDRWSPRS